MLNPVLPVVTGIILAALFQSILFGIGALICYFSPAVYKETQNGNGTY